MTKQLSTHLFALLLLLAGCAQPGFAQPIETMGEAINQAGRQRMLTQRIVKAYAQMGQDIRYLVASEQLNEAISLFEQQLEQLKAYTSDQEAQQMLNRVSTLWLPVKSIAGADVYRDQASKLRAQAEKLLGQAHQVVLRLEKLSGSSQGHLVNIAGRQRMLSQRMGNLYMLLSWGFEDPQYKADYQKAVKEFSTALNELTNAPENTPEITQLLQEVRQNWEMFKLSNRMGKGEYIPTLVVRMLDRILVQMNEVTGMYAALPEK